MASEVWFHALVLPFGIDFFDQHIEYNTSNCAISPSCEYVNLDYSLAVALVSKAAAGAVVAHFSCSTLPLPRRALATKKQRMTRSDVTYNYLESPSFRRVMLIRTEVLYLRI